MNLFKSKKEQSQIARLFNQLVIFIGEFVNLTSDKVDRDEFIAQVNGLMAILDDIYSLLPKITDKYDYGKSRGILYYDEIVILTIVILSKRLRTDNTRNTMYLNLAKLLKAFGSSPINEIEFQSNKEQKVTFLKTHMTYKGKNADNDVLAQLSEWLSGSSVSVFNTLSAVHLLEEI